MKNTKIYKKLCGLALAFFLFAPPIFAESNYVVPAEWEKQESVWYAWPVFEPIAGKSNIPQIVQMIKLLSYSASGELIDLIVADKKEQANAEAALKAANADLAKVRFRLIAHTDFWMRDYLVFVKDRATNQLGIVDFGFLAWGMGSASHYFYKISGTDGNIDTNMATLLGVPAITPDTDPKIVMEPGGLEFNGIGNLILSEAVLLQNERNPGLTKEVAEETLAKLFNIKKADIIWLPKFRYNADTNKEEIVSVDSPDYYLGANGGGLVADDSPFYGVLPNPFPDTFRPAGYEDAAFNNVLTPLTTNGHTDEFVRWVSADTVLVADVDASEVAGEKPDSVAVRTKWRLDKIQSILSNSVNAKGKKIKVVKIPVANEKVHYLKSGDGTYDGILGMMITTGADQGKLLTSYFPKGKAAFLTARSYLNYVVTNDYIFMPSYAGSDVTEDTNGYHAIKSKDKDLIAKAILEKYFGNSPFNKTGKIRKVVIIDNVDDINISGGGLHCISQQMPESTLTPQK